MGFKFPSIFYEKKGCPIYFLFTGSLLLLCGCSKVEPTLHTPSEPVLSRHYRQESATVILSVSETNIFSSGQIRLMLDVQAPLGAQVVIPQIETAVTPFLVADGYLEPVQILPNGKELHRQVWLLVPALPGSVIFHPLEILVGSQTVATEAIAIAVRSRLPPELNVFEIKDIAPPLAQLPEQKKRKKQGFILLGLALGMSLLALGIKLARRPKNRIESTPYETALLALKNLPEDPLEKTHALSELLRVFVGGRFEFPTEGKTIHEVVPLLPKKVLLGRRHKLEAFLLKAEQIRFSNQRPKIFAADYENYVRDFVEEMREKPCD